MFENYQKDRQSQERLKYFNQEDFKNASVLDLGANEGAFENIAKEWGAKKYKGIDKEPRGKNVEMVDLDNANWRKIPRSDVVLMLSIGKYLKNLQEVFTKAENKTKKVMYFEDHQQEYEPDRFNSLKKQLKWEKLGETPNKRPFYRGLRV